MQEKSSQSRYGGTSSLYEGIGSPIREEPPPSYNSAMQRHKSFDNPLAGAGSSSYKSQDDEPVSQGCSKFGKALYDFTAGGDDETQDSHDKGVQNEGFVQVDVEGNAPNLESPIENTNAAEEVNADKSHVTNLESVFLSNKMPAEKNSVFYVVATPAKTSVKRKLESEPDEEE